MTPNLNPDFKEFLQLLAANRVDYLIIGGYAVAAHGHPRYTKDIDIWVHSTPENAARLITTLEQFGFASLGLVAGDFLQPDTVVQLGYPPRRIDLLTAPSGVVFEECYSQKMVTETDGTPLNFSRAGRLESEQKGFGSAAGPR